MKNRIFALLAILLAFSLTACAPELDPGLLDAGQPPVLDVPAAPEAPPETEEAPAQEPSVQEPGTEAPGEAPAVDDEATEGSAAVTAEDQPVSGSYDELVSYAFGQPVFSGFASPEADAEASRYYEELVAELVQYAYDYAYKTAQERHTGADVTGTWSLEPSDAGVVRVQYSVTVQFGDRDEAERHQRTDTLDWSTGQQVNRER